MTRTIGVADGVRAPTVALAEFAAGLELDGIPEHVLHQAKRALIDHLAAALGGSAQPAAQLLRRVAQRLAPVTQATVIGSADRTSAPFAALLNGYSAHVLDYDDTYNPGRTTIHGSSSVWPVIFALGELSTVSGRKALESFVVAFEVEARVASAAGPAHYDVGYHPTGTAGHVGAAVAAAKVLGLSSAYTVNAIGCAATQAAGLKVVYGSDCKALHPAKAAMDGVLAGLLAQEGFTSSRNSLEGYQGLLHVMSTSPEPKLLVDGLGAVWHLASNGYKAYPSGSLTHPTVDALLALRKEDGFTADDVTSIDARVHTYAATVTGNSRPTTTNEAKFSLAHCAAVAVANGRLILADFEPDVVNDPRLAELRSRVALVVDETLSKRAASVAVTLADGRTLRRFVADNKGTPDNPFDDEEIESKFLAVAEPALGDTAAREVLGLCWQVDQVDDVSPIIRAMVGAA